MPNEHYCCVLFFIIRTNEHLFPMCAPFTFYIITIKLIPLFFFVFRFCSLLSLFRFAFFSSVFSCCCFLQLFILCVLYPFQLIFLHHFTFFFFRCFSKCVLFCVFPFFVCCLFSASFIYINILQFFALFLRAQKCMLQCSCCLSKNHIFFVWIIVNVCVQSFLVFLKVSVP